MATGYAPDEQSFRRIANVVRTVEATFPSTDAEKRGTPNGRQLYLFRRLPLVGDSTRYDNELLRTEFMAIQPEQRDGWDFANLPPVCSGREPTDSVDLPQYEVNQGALLEGVIFPGQLFHAVNIDHSWYAVGEANTSIQGVYDLVSGTITVEACDDLEVPVITLVSPDDDVDGSVAKADWLRHRRQYVLSAFGCEP